MECNKWQEEGLLYISKELDFDKSKEFQRHCESCSTCRTEMQEYTFDAKTFFKQSFIGESPSEDIDNKIIAACSQAPRMTGGLGIFSGFWFKKAVISTFFLIIGMSAGVYFTMNYFTGSSSSVIASSIKNPSTIPPSGQVASAAAMAKIDDTSTLRKKDSLKRTEPAQFIGQDRRSVAQQQGIITVDLKKE